MKRIFKHVKKWNKFLNKKKSEIKNEIQTKKITIINLAAKRKALGYTQKEFAKTSGISVKTLWKAEVEKPISKRVFTEILLTLFDLPTLMIDEQLD